MSTIPPLRTSLNANKSQRRNFRKLYRETKLPFRSAPDFSDRADIDDFLSEIDQEIATRRYMPSTSRGILTEERGNGVPRFIPLFELKDSCVYYHCVSTLERESQFVERVANTFAGWKQSNSLRIKEELEIDALESKHALPALWSPYPEPQIELYRFRRLWRDFAHAAYLHSRSKQDGVAVMIDISNFFYSISLPILQQKIRHSVNPTYAATIDLLFGFLANCDRSRLGYFPNTHGIPVEELGDSSRVLAQIYLHEYDDRILEYCESRGADYGYIRFADDQIFFAPNMISAERMLFAASQFLYDIGLQVNTSKVRFFDDMSDFDYFWSFDIIESSQYRSEFNFDWLTEEYLSRVSSPAPRPWRDDRLRHLIIEHASSENLNTENLDAFLDDCLQPNHIRRLDHRKMLKLFQLSTEPNRTRLFRLLTQWSDRTRFNGFHLNLLRFAEAEEVKTSAFSVPDSARMAMEAAYAP